MLGGTWVTSPAAWAHHDRDKDFTLTGEFTDFEVKDRGKNGPSEGDEYSFEFDLFDHGDDAGNGDGDCELTDVGDRHDGRHRDFTADCNVVLKLDDGDLELEGEVERGDFRDGEITLPIVDGTDDYDDADGEVTFRPADDHDGKQHHSRGHGHGDHEFEVEVDLD